MNLPSDILDYIISFLKPYPESLIAFSKVHPSFSRMAERHRYYNITININTILCNITNRFNPFSLIGLVLGTPRIANYVRVLQFEFQDHPTAATMPDLESISLVLPMFGLLECIRLITRHDDSWQTHLPQSFRTAVEKCLHLPTLRMVHIGHVDFPLSILDDHVNIDYLSLSGLPQVPATSDSPETPYPQLKSLEITGIRNLPFFSIWAKRRIVKLESLTYDYSSDHTILELCSDTLNNLDLTLGHSAADYCTQYDADGADPYDDILPNNLPPLPHLRHLTVRAHVYFDSEPPDPVRYCFSFLPAAVEIIKMASSPALRHVTFDIDIDVSYGSLDEIDFSPLTALAECSNPSPQIDLYIYSKWPHLSFAHTTILSLLADDEDLMELIEQGVLVIHAHEPSPQFFWQVPPFLNKWPFISLALPNSGTVI
jgi:hypothetical protein